MKTYRESRAEDAGRTARGGFGMFGCPFWGDVKGADGRLCLIWGGETRVRLRSRRIQRLEIGGVVFGSDVGPVSQIQSVLGFLRGIETGRGVKKSHVGEVESVVLG